MTTATTLSTSWTKIADAGSIFVTLEIDGEAEFVFAASAPSSPGGHPATETTRIAGSWDDNLYVCLADDDSSGMAYVDQTTSSLEAGSGLSLVRIAPSITVISL